jgi:hypothetical protein
MPIDRGILDLQLQALGESAHWWDRRELRDLPTVLDADERVLAVSRGKVARPRWLHRSWLIVVTDRRVICLRSSGRPGWRQLQVSVRRISRVALRVGLFRGRVLVVADGSTLRLLVPRADAYRLHHVLASFNAPARDALTGFGPTRMIRNIIDHVLTLPAAALNPDLPAQLPPPAPPDDFADQRVQLLEDQVEQLRQHVDFMEQLLRERHERSVTERSVTERSVTERS